MSYAFMQALLLLLVIATPVAFVASEGELPHPSCNATFTCPNPNNPQNTTDIATFPHVLNETDCLAACIYCVGDSWRCSDHRKHTHNNLATNMTETKYECRCAVWSQGCVEDEWRRVCVDEGYDSPSGAAGGGLMGASAVVGLASAAVFQLMSI